MKGTVGRAVNWSRRSRITPLFLVVLAIVCTLPGGVAAQEQGVVTGETGEELYRDIADAVVRQVLRDGLGNTTTRELLQRARRVDPENGDALYLSASLLTDLQSRQVEREGLLRAALAGRLNRISRQRVVIALGELLYGQRRYREVLDLFHNEAASGTIALPLHEGVLPVQEGDTGIPQLADSSTATVGEAEKLYLAARLHIGPYWYMGAYLQRLRSRFPDDAELAYLDFSREERVSLSVLEWMDNRHLTGRSVPPELLIHTIRTAPSESIRRDLGTLYVEQGGSDILARLAVNDTERNASPEVESSDKLYWEYLHRWYGNDASTPTGETMQGYHTLVLDEDRDSFWEERYHLNGDALHTWERDADENGIVDGRVEFHTSPMITVYLASDNRSVTEIRYAPYPMVTRVSQIHLEPSRSVTVWTPARPPRVPAGLEEELGNGWNPYVDRLTLDPGMLNRFERQLASDDARTGRPEEFDFFMDALRQKNLVVFP